MPQLHGQIRPCCWRAFAYAYIGFGPRAAFVCGWALVIGYLAIVAIDIAALSVIFRFLFPGVFEFGELYSIAGWTVYSGEVILMTAGTLFFGTSTTAVSALPAPCS